MTLLESFSIGVATGYFLKEIIQCLLNNLPRGEVSGIRIVHVHNHRRCKFMTVKPGDVVSFKLVPFDSQGADLPADALKDAVLAWASDSPSATFDTPSAQSVNVTFSAEGTVNLTAAATWPDGESFSAALSVVVAQPLVGPPAGLAGVKIVQA